MTKLALLQETEQVANELLADPLMDNFYKDCIRRKIAALKANPTAKNIYNTIDDLNVIAVASLREVNAAIRACQEQA